MISFDIFLLGLMIVSTLTGLVVEAVKKILIEHNVAYQANTLAGIVSAILSAAISIGYIVFSGTEFTAKIIVCIIAMIFMSWLCSMVGYDKVVGMLKTTKKD